MGRIIAWWNVLKVWAKARGGNVFIENAIWIIIVVLALHVGFRTPRWRTRPPPSRIGMVMPKGRKCVDHARCLHGEELNARRHDA